MPDYRRWFVPGGCFFFTVVVHGRRPLFDDVRAVALLGKVMRDCLERWPVTVNAIVLLPDHLHAIWTLPTSDAAYPKRWGWIKKEFGEFKLQMQQAKRPGFEGVFDVCSRFPENSRAELLAASKISPRLSLKVVAFEV